LRSKGEKFGEMGREAGADFVERHVAMEELFERGGFAVGDTAGNDEVEVAQIGGNIVGEAVRSDPAADVDTDSSELFFGNSARRLDPDAGFAWDAMGGDAEIGGSADHRFFESADVPVNVATDAIEIEDGVADGLAGAMISDIATAVGLAKFDALLAEDVFGSEEIFLAGVAAKGDDMRVLAEEKDVGDGSGFARGDKALLESERSIPAADSDVANEKRLEHWKGIADSSEQRAGIFCILLAAICSLLSNALARTRHPPQKAAATR